MSFVNTLTPPAFQSDWQSFTAVDRPFGDWFENNNLGPRAILITYLGNAIAPSTFDVWINETATTTGAVGQRKRTTVSNHGAFLFIVPPGQHYIVDNITGPATFIGWWELQG